MDARYLLDTDICIYVRQQRPQVVQHFRKLRDGEAVLSVITYGELMYGAAKSGHRTAALSKMRELMLFLPVMPLPETAGELYGTVRAELEAKGEMIGNNDLWIAAHALAADLTLVTNNQKEFRRIRGLKLLNWV